jgi:hypothetical protein
MQKFFQFFGGAVLLILGMVWAALQHWSLFDPAIAKLKESGPTGALIAQFITSPLFMLILGTVGLYLIANGLSEIKKNKKEAQLQPSVSPVIHIENNPHIEVNQHPAPAMADQRSSGRSKPESSEPTPNVIFLGSKTIRIRSGLTSGFYESDSQNDALASIACFRNELSPSRRVAPAFDIRACIIYRDSVGQEIGTGISEACWMGDLRRINFPVGESNCVILVISLADGNLFSPFLRHTRSGWGNGIVTDTYPLNVNLKTIDLRLIRGNDLLLEPIVFDFGTDQNRPIVKQRVMAAGA